jgi:hypothetical protein
MPLPGGRPGRCALASPAPRGAMDGPRAPAREASTSSRGCRDPWPPPSCASAPAVASDSPVRRRRISTASSKRTIASSWRPATRWARPSTRRAPARGSSGSGPTAAAGGRSASGGGDRLAPRRDGREGGPRGAGRGAWRGRGRVQAACVRTSGGGRASGVVEALGNRAGSGGRPFTERHGREGVASRGKGRRGAGRGQRSGWRGARTGAPGRRGKGSGKDEVHRTTASRPGPRGPPRPPPGVPGPARARREAARQA